MKSKWLFFVSMMLVWGMLQVGGLAFDPVRSRAFEQQLVAQMDASAQDIERLVKEEEQNTQGDRLLHQVKLAILYHNASRFLFPKGIKGYAEKGENLLDHVVNDPALPAEWRPLVLGYLGSLKALVGNESINPITKLGAVHDGFKWLDQAVNDYGKVSYLPTLIRSNVASAVPDFFHKEKVAMEDLIYLDKRFSADPSFVPSRLMVQVYLNLGNQYKKRKEISQSIVYWKKASALDPKGDFGGKAAREMLDIFADE